MNGVSANIWRKPARFEFPLPSDACKRHSDLNSKVRETCVIAHCNAARRKRRERKTGDREAIAPQHMWRAQSTRLLTQLTRRGDYPRYKRAIFIFYACFLGAIATRLREVAADATKQKQKKEKKMTPGVQWLTCLEVELRSRFKPTRKTR